ncbi:UPF0656 protein [Fulvia fulva]|uniref:UPF0656 protein n=1 Tax=Passalora fulva TaxID=5499 RepID=A0A9Q8P2B3_PASFU|nr:UPF0656 protein [Fulvia fulva]KAK4634464.1 UPF0656 protein [Fulvia fulva]KAK4638249.1 UPF0656 protein [Fulvia fulva]UJO10798.1 UPF0656 protein [Fulvia fulva]WPV09471.1 UPF0656 protein [Fulvia fulva]WPV24324.1 UPF0656 protein [Fulvia fulva]
MAAGKPKQFTRPPPKKKPQKAALLDTVDDFQEAADHEESAGGKHRVGDAVKSGRAFVRALDIYDRGLQKHPASFDLAYNKACLQLEISQQANLVEHIGVSILDWLKQTLESHRYALKLSEENPDILFNAAQVLTLLSEQLSDQDRAEDAVPLLQEALELLSSCLSRQEIMFEQHRLDFPDTEDGGVSLDPEADETPAPSTDVDMAEEQSAIVETPIAASDLLDTVHASLSALTTLVPLTEPSGLQNLGDMAHSLTESKVPHYLSLLPAEDQDQARFAVALDRATFIAAYANAQFEAQMIELQTYLERLNTFDIANKDDDAGALCAEAEARTELVLSVMDRFDETPDLPASLCWKQLSLCQDLYSKATKPTGEDIQERKAEVYKSKGDLELLRHRVANIPKTDIADGVRKSAATLIQNAQTYFKGAVSHAKISGDDEVEEDAQQRWALAKAISALMHGGEGAGNAETLMEALEECVEEGLVSEQLAQALMSGSVGSGSGSGSS